MQVEADILPISEIRLLLLNHRHPLEQSRSPAIHAVRISMNDISKMVKCQRRALYAIIRGKPMDKKDTHTALGPTRLRRLSQLLLRIEVGLIYKEDGIIKRRSEPTKPMPIIRKVSLGLDGPRLMPAASPLQAPSKMPQFHSVFRNERIPQPLYLIKKAPPCR